MKSDPKFKKGDLITFRPNPIHTRPGTLAIVLDPFAGKRDALDLIGIMWIKCKRRGPAAFGAKETKYAYEWKKVEENEV